MEENIKVDDLLDSIKYIYKINKEFIDSKLDLYTQYSLASEGMNKKFEEYIEQYIDNNNCISIYSENHNNMQRVVDINIKYSEDFIITLYPESKFKIQINLVTLDKKENIKKCYHYFVRYDSSLYRKILRICKEFLENEFLSSYK